jgi:hypothetical protein
MPDNADLSAGIDVPKDGKPPKPAEAPAPAKDEPPPWLPDRLKQARQTAQQELLSQFGAQKPEDVAAKLKRLQEMEDSKLSEKERSEKEIAALRVQASEAERYRALFHEQTKAELATLSEQELAAVNAYGGDNPVEQHRMVQAFRMAKAAQAGAPPPAPVAAPPAPPATSVPKGSPPAPAPGTPKTAFEQWQALEQTNPIGASIFLMSNRMAIDASRPA